MDTALVQGSTLHLPPPDALQRPWVGQTELLKQLLAAWSVLDDDDLPLSPRLVGRPGVGKTTLAIAAAQALDRPLYLMQATVDTRPEDLLVVPVIDEGRKLRYVASSLVSAMIRGGVCVLDEANRMSEKSWASLAPLLDGRRYVESVIAGVKIHAHPEFRFCATMNEDASTFDLPDYIHSRLQPRIVVDFPERDDERSILQANLPLARHHVIEYLTAFLQRAHEADEPYTVRDGINIARYALKLDASRPASNDDVTELLRLSTTQMLGDEALMYLPGAGALETGDERGCTTPTR